MSVILHNTDILIYLQCNFNLSVCMEIYGEESNHLFEKWLTCDGNLLNYITRLDKNNRYKLLNWGLKNSKIKL